LDNEYERDLIADVRKIWDTWDLKEKDGETNDDRLEFDSFYNGFMAPYFGCFRCEDTRLGLRALDMDHDGDVDWSEFLVYLKWAVREYEDIKDADELLAVVFRKGIMPAMRDHR
jgi:Ca2+-binding EF-hand superfamily protein